MYCIMSVIYGVPLTEAAHDLIGGKGLDEDGNKIIDEDAGIGTGDPEACGFETLYSGHARWSPGYCGVHIDGFDEACDVIDVSELQLKPTPEEMAEAEKRVAALDPRIRALCPAIGVYIIPSTS